ncbi:glycosyltransferase family 2 protein [Desulfurivibrio sp. D14AmB]|uniref:glycosyltransferase family 2 protein n=1 Tax=Desulfurivibrio sp. D14AmB TaxID=3374370 RepID=UPI00376EC1D1
MRFFVGKDSGPLISVIVAVFDGADTLQKCMESVVRQTYPAKELIIIDGGSKDGTVDLLRRYHRQINYWVSEPDHGVYNAWNKGLARASGEWICFLGADDFFWDPRVLERMAARLPAIAPEIMAVYGRVMLLNMQGKELGLIGEPWENVRGRFRQIMCVPHPGLMHRRTLFERHGQFDESFRIAGDYELLLRELKTGQAFFVSDIVVAGMRQGGISSSPQNALRSLRETRRAQQRHGQNLPGIIWLLAVTRVYGRILLWKMVGKKLAGKILDWGRRMMGLPPYWAEN